MISTLINKLDSNELIRDQIALVLANEVASQISLAEAEVPSVDPTLWDLHIYTDRHNPWDQFLLDGADLTPIVNVLYEASLFDPHRSDLFERQQVRGTYFIDCYGAAVGSTDGEDGQLLADQEAAKNCARAVRLVRNILMASEYQHLGFPQEQEGGYPAWDRWMSSTQVLRPDKDSTTAQAVVATRLTFEVSFNEFSPQIEPGTVELVAVVIKRAEDGKVIGEANYTYPL